MPWWLFVTITRARRYLSASGYPLYFGFSDQPLAAKRSAKKRRAVRDLEIVLTLAAFSFGLMSAWFWYRASRVVTVPVRLGWVEPGSPEATQWISGLLAASNEAARLNKIAALWTVPSELAPVSIA